MAGMNLMKELGGNVCISCPTLELFHTNGQLDDLTFTTDYIDSYADPIHIF